VTTKNNGRRRPRSCIGKRAFHPFIGLLVPLAFLLAAPLGVTGQEMPPVGPPQITTRDIAPDALAFLGALVLRMRGAKGGGATDPVVFTKAAAGRIAEDFLYEEFELQGVTFREYGFSPRDPKAVHFAGFLHFADGFGRRTIITYSADYGFIGDKIFVTRVNVNPLYLPDPEVELYFVPAERIPRNLLRAHPGFIGLLDFVIANAIPLDRPELLPKGVRDYYLFAFFMDRLAPDTRVDIRISTAPEVIPKQTANSTALHFDGWQVAVLRRQFALNSGPKLFFQALYRLGYSAPPNERAPRLAETFSSHVK
jgi:hypothetical protein